ncbi:Hypothetical predicted protein [Xyrichtys novacula]|uniref:Uncharacterized protein n=1 Tax=Xyrichtys novacula TaxID=13765 RepID=A0AAV1GRD3_XYRNO|nr:Hypothetical predicted protein [Xyrichtys novacula]
MSPVDWERGASEAESSKPEKERGRRRRSSCNPVKERPHMNDEETESVRGCRRTPNIRCDTDGSIPACPLFYRFVLIRTTEPIRKKRPLSDSPHPADLSD